MASKQFIAFEQVHGLPQQGQAALFRNLDRLSRLGFISYVRGKGDNVSTTTPMELKFYLPELAEKIYAINLNFTLAKFRGSATGTLGGGSSTVTSGIATTGITVSESHVVTDPGHTHSVDVAAHTHTISYGVYEGTVPQDVTITVDGTDRTSALGGPFNDDQSDLDITDYVSGTGWHTIAFGTSQDGFIDADIFVLALGRRP